MLRGSVTVRVICRVGMNAMIKIMTMVKARVSVAIRDRVAQFNLINLPRIHRSLTHIL